MMMTTICMRLRMMTKLFEEDGGLREYYEKNSESGRHIFCLMCSGDYGGLVRHAIIILNTKQAQRDYSQVIFQIRRWNINMLPSIVLSACGKPSESFDKLVEA
ncbi:hypothetical protein H5410_062065 [Solanum commersonii]|uniref:Uncharacterized protein n=1 Tax=Solanum commersonii TaxID=4109 RepID=A0A9J5W9E0_SOLCO|nr:hypothetical protein H5410_062065 [Solanum commersonii]